MANLQAQCVKANLQITEQESLQLTRNLLRIAIFNISYIRGLFPEKYFDDKYVPALEMKIKKLMPLDQESRRLIDWMEKGVYDALKKKYLKSLVFSLSDGNDELLIEEYTFCFRYGEKGEEISVDLKGREGDKKSDGAVMTSSSDVTPGQMKSSACKMVRTLVQLMRTLDGVPDERTILMKLFYYDNITPHDYEPPYFRAYSEDKSHSWCKSPLKLAVGEVNSKHYAIALKVRSILDPCEDETGGKDNMSQSQSISCSSDASKLLSLDESGLLDKKTTEVSVVAAMLTEPVAQAPIDIEPRNRSDSAETEDLEYESESLSTIKKWIFESKREVVDIADIMASFPELSVALIEGLLQNLITEGTLTMVSKDMYNVEIRGQNARQDNREKNQVSKTQNYAEDVNKMPESDMYDKALGVLQLEYVTIASVQKQIGSEMSFSMAKRMVDKMIDDGYIEQTASNRRMGRKVLMKQKDKVQEVTNSLSSISLTKRNDCSSNGEFPISTGFDASTMAQQQSHGSDITRSVLKVVDPIAYKNEIDKASGSQAESGGSGYAAVMGGSTLTPAGSCTSPGRQMQLCQPDASSEQDCEGSEKIRKASIVDNPIHQSVKRLRIEEA